MTSSLVARASLWAMVGGTSQFLITFGLLIYLARVLDPHDFGLMATVTIGLDLGMQIARWGQIELLQQSRYQSDDARNQALRVSLSIALLFCTLFVAIAQPLSHAYQSPELATMLYLCAPVFIFSSLNATADGILRSQFRFRKIAYRGSLAAVAGGIVAVALAASDYGPLALAGQRFVQSIVSVTWTWSAVDWRPKLTAKLPYSRALMVDGASTMIGTLLPTLVPRSIDLFISVLLGPAALGLYKIAFRIFEFVAQLTIMPLVTVANAQLARFHADPGGLRQSYLRFTQVSATLLCPLMIGFAIVAPEAVPILFGPKWISSIPLVQMVSILALTAPPNYFFPATMIAIGQSRLIIRQGVFQLVVGLGLAAIAAQYSLTAVLVTQIVRGMMLTAYNFRYLKIHTGLQFGEVARRMAPPYVATAAMCVITLGLRVALYGRCSPLVLLIVLTGAGGLAYLGTILLGVRLRLWPDFLLVIERLVPDRLRRFMPG